MSYKQPDNNFSFTDLSLLDSMEHNRSISRMDRINAIINWTPVDAGQDYYEERYRSWVIQNLKRKAQEMGYELVSIQESTASVLPK